MRQKLVVFTGAGISAESGIPTFRDANGMWGKYDAMKLASVEGFEEAPQAVLDFYNARRKNLLEVQPNHAHFVLAELEKQYDVTIVTQNVDNLHERAGSSKVLHLHGELSKVTSSRNRLDSNCIKDYPLDVPIRLGDKAADGSQLRPYIVWFSEYVDNMEEAIHFVEQADVFVVIGTSLVVCPAAGLVNYAKREIPKFLIDPNDINGGLPMGYQHIKATAVEGVDELVRRLEELENSVFSTE
jgi:NAD-dependent deacetylase